MNKIREEWFNAVKTGIYQLNHSDEMKLYKVKGISFSGQMHGLVALDKEGHPVRHAILWNDTRNSEQCKQIGIGLWRAIKWKSDS